MAKAKDKPQTEQTLQRAPRPTRLPSLFDEFDRMFPSAWPTRAWPARWPDWSEFANLQGRMPPVDVIDREKEVIVRAEVPGVSKDELDVTVTDSTLTLRGEYRKEEKEEKGEYYRSETCYGGFSRTLNLPADVDAAKAKAKFENGIVEITLPKVAATKRRSIKVE